MKPEVYFHDAEPEGEWTNTSTLATVEQAHSGTRVSLLDSATEFSLTFNKQLQQLYKGMPAKIKVSAWVKAIDPVKNSSLVVSIEKEGKSAQWESVMIKSVVRETGKWNLVERTFEVNKDIKPDMFLKTYIWNTDKSRMMMDDLRIEFY